MRENIHYCKKEDFEPVYSLLKQLWPKKNLLKDVAQGLFLKSINTTNKVQICYKYKGKIVGFCSMSITQNFSQQGEKACIDDLIVDENYRKKGIGLKLITEIILIARFRGCKRIELNSYFDRKKSHAFYEDLGFENHAYLFSKVL